jgi:carbon storage regulator
MLVLTRKLGESIVIDGNIRVKVVDVQGQRVRLGIEAPPEITVDRQEIHERRREFAEAIEEAGYFAPTTSNNGVNALCRAR